MFTSKTRVILVIGLGLCAATSGVADDRKWSSYLGPSLAAGNGIPSNDIPGLEVEGRYRFSPRWTATVEVGHSSEFDVERVADLVGLASPEVVDATASSTAVSGWLERPYHHGDRWESYWGVGIGVNWVDVETATGPREPCAPPCRQAPVFFIETDAGSEVLLRGRVGGRRWLSENWGLEAAVRTDQHFAEWMLVDRFSGASGSVDDYFVKGVTLGVTRRL